jgi:hypothetical protein
MHRILIAYSSLAPDGKFRQQNEHIENHYRFLIELAVGRCELLARRIPAPYEDCH